jgi:hypothetical protein
VADDRKIDAEVLRPVPDELSRYVAFNAEAAAAMIRRAEADENIAKHNAEAERHKADAEKHKAEQAKNTHALPAQAERTRDISRVGIVGGVVLAIGAAGCVFLPPASLADFLGRCVTALIVGWSGTEGIRWISKAIASRRTLPEGDGRGFPPPALPPG